jgi:polysaccharide pyruvyl transferase WcaK-like protein
VTDEIVLITRVRTLNKGNQALSAAWLAMLQRAFPDAAIRLLERRPRHLVQYSLRRLAMERDPVAAFDRLTTKLAAMAPGPELAGPVRGKTAILLDETIPPPQRFGALRQRLNLRGLLAATGYYADDYRKRLSACQRAKLVVVNPAGEFFPRDPQAALYHLLDAAVANKLGCPTAIVNHTLDLDDPTLRKIIPVLYRSLSLVGFRDGKSIEAFRKMGGDPSNVLVTPDLALTHDFSGTHERRTGVVGVTVNAPEALSRGYLEQWIEVIEGLLARGFKVELISNEMPAELEFYEQLQRRFKGVTIAGAGLGHDKYAELLATYELVISSRMHTGILAMVTGTPVVPVEGASFKITALFQELGLANPVIQPTQSGWARRVLDEVMAVRGQGEAASVACSSKVSAARDRIITLLVPRLQEAARSTAQQRVVS